MRFEHGRRVGEQHRDGVAHSDALGAERRGKPAAPRIELGVARPCLAMNDGGVIGMHACRTLEEDERGQRLVVGRALAEACIVRVGHPLALDLARFPCLEPSRA